MRKDKILAFINAGIFLFFGNSFLLLFDIMNHSCILELCFVGERGDQGNVHALLNLLDVGITQGKGNFRRETSADRSTACESDQNNTEIFEIAQGVFCKSAKCSIVILLHTFFQLDQIAVFYASKFPQFLIVRVMMYIIFMVFKQYVIEVFLYLFLMFRVEAVILYDLLDR